MKTECTETELSNYTECYTDCKIVKDIMRETKSLSAMTGTDIWNNAQIRLFLLCSYSLVNQIYVFSLG